MTDDTKQNTSARAVEEDVIAARADLRNTLNNLEDRLSPEALVNQAIACFRNEGRRHADTVFREARMNPLPFVLMGVGAAWLVLNVLRRDKDWRQPKTA